jgi:hypothetical protein
MGFGEGGVTQATLTLGGAAGSFVGGSASLTTTSATPFCQ